MRRRESGSGSNAAGQSGDIQGLDSQRIEELIEEGQAFEAGVLGGIEDAPDADVAEVTTRQVREDDVPGEYLERDQG